MRVLGISAFYHDSAAALIEDGRVVAAAQEAASRTIEETEILRLSVEDQRLIAPYTGNLSQFPSRKLILLQITLAGEKNIAGLVRHSGL